MAYDIWDGDDEAEAGRLVPLYMLVGGRTAPRNVNLDLATQVIAKAVDASWLDPEYGDIVGRCATWISIAEIAAHLRLPLTIVRIMADVLIEQGYLDIGSPAQQTADRRLLETVLDGLQRL